LKARDDEVYEFNPVIMGKTENGENLLHLFANEFMQYPHGVKLLERISREKALVKDLKKMSLEPEHEGLTPFLLYFRDIKDALQNYQFTNCLSNQDTTDHTTQTFIPEAVKTLRQATLIYANVFNYDISSRASLTKSKRDEAKDLFDTKSISQ
jgi:hypothetical protein